MLCVPNTTLLFLLCLHRIPAIHLYHVDALKGLSLRHKPLAPLLQVSIQIFLSYLVLSTLLPGGAFLCRPSTDFLVTGIHVFVD